MGSVPNNSELARPFLPTRDFARSREMLFLVIERFRDGNAAPVYARFRAQGRLAPADVEYINSWVTHDLTTCYQVMAAPSRERLDEWIAAWSDLVEFEVIPVLTSAEASARAGSGQG